MKRGGALGRGQKRYPTDKVAAAIWHHAVTRDFKEGELPCEVEDGEVVLVDGEDGPEPILLYKPVAPCRVCGAKKNGVEGHHVLPKQTIKTEWGGRLDNARLQVLLWELPTILLGKRPRNGMPLCGQCHTDHELAVRRVPRFRLTADNWDFATELGLAWKLERTYPDDADSRV